MSAAVSPIVTAMEATDKRHVGGKAAALAKLTEAGFGPPDFFVIPVEAFSDHAALSAELPGALARLGSGPYAVRSSASAEDGFTHSHAGQFESYLNVAAEEVMTKAMEVWRSGNTSQVATYREAAGVADHRPPSVIVQRMVPAVAAGVAFSADPVSGRRDQTIISAVKGLGDALVNGEEDGEDWRVDIAGNLVETPGSPQALTPAQAKDIAALARRAEAYFGHPQDIEWAIDTEGLHILQARPITTALRPPPNPDHTLTVFDNSNIIESYPGVVSPLTYSFAVHVYARVYYGFMRLLGVRPQRLAQNSDLFDNLLSRIDGRVYYNLGQWYRALAMLPGFAANKAHMETMMGVDEPLPAELTDALTPALPHGWARWQSRVDMARAALGLAWQALWLGRTKRRFQARLDAVLASGFAPEHASLTELAAEYRRVEGLILDRWDAPLINDFLCMMAFGASRKLLEKWLGPRGLQLHNDVMIGQGDIVSAEPAARIAKMGGMIRDLGLTERLEMEGIAALENDSALQQEFEAYLAKFGDRCTEELKLESIPLSEEAGPLLAAITASARISSSQMARAEPPDWRALFPKQPLRRWLSRVALGFAKARVRDRENLRFQRTRIFGLARRLFRAMGREMVAYGTLDDPRDVFYLTKSEVLGAVEGHGLSPDIRALAALRKAEDMASITRPDPPERIEHPGARLAPSWRTDAPIRELSARKTAIGCSAGQIKATARVIRDPRSESLNDGEILVARHTDPGWIAVFANASGIVVERGSLLSHSAIVARELGIPCVVGLKGATGWITSGETLRIDGSTGEVERCNVTSD